MSTCLHYQQPHGNYEDPEYSPYHGENKGLKNLYIVCAEDECLKHQIVEYTKLLTDLKVEFELEIVPKMFHDFVIFYNLKESTPINNKIIKLI
jgi:acetyl esterase/lipase